MVRLGKAKINPKAFVAFWGGLLALIPQGPKHNLGLYFTCGLCLNSNEIYVDGSL